MTTNANLASRFDPTAATNPTIQPPTLPTGAAMPYARTPASLPECRYFVYRPSGDYDRTRLMVAVHGITRNALEHAMSLKRWSDRLRIPVVAPLFSRSAYRRYQTLRGGKGSPSADDAFDRIVADAVAHLSMAAPKIFLFGYSGGGQFAHRYLFRHPDAVERAVIGAAGWYSFPDETLAYPLGLAAGARTPALAAIDAIDRYPPTLVVVGSQDRMRDEALNQDPEIDRAQGRHRLARAKRWVAAMNDAASRRGRPPPCRLQVLRGASHAFAPAMATHGMDRVVIEFLFGDTHPSLFGERQ